MKNNISGIVVFKYICYLDLVLIIGETTIIGGHNPAVITTNYTNNLVYHIHWEVSDLGKNNGNSDVIKILKNLMAMLEY